MEAGIPTIRGLSCSKPQGSLYMLVKLDPSIHGTNDMAFCRELYAAQGVFLMPGTCFDAPGYVRVVIASPADIMRDVVERLREFCAARLED